jgi:hypothetical protein
MSHGKDLSAVDRWNHAVRVAYDDPASDLIDQVLAMTDAEVLAELRADGVDLDAFDAEMDALYEQHVGAAASPAKAPVVAAEADETAWTKGDATPSVRGKPRKERRGRHVVAYAAVAAAATAGVATYLATRPPPEAPDVKPKDREAPKAPKPAPAPSATPVVDARANDGLGAKAGKGGKGK